MNLSDLSAVAAEQDAGHWFELTHPVTGEGTAIMLLIAGPDSNRQQEALRAYQDALANSRRKRGGKRTDALYLECLADFILDIDATEAGEPVPFSRDVALKTVGAGDWIRRQIEAFAGDRRVYAQGGN